MTKSELEQLMEVWNIASGTYDDVQPDEATEQLLNDTYTLLQRELKAPPPAGER